MSDGADKTPVLREVALDIAPPALRVQEQTVKLLEIALERARKGEIVDAVVTATEPDGQNWFIYSDALSTSKRIGMLEIVKAIMMRDHIAECD